MSTGFEQAVGAITERTDGLRPRVACILGSGLGAVSEAVSGAVAIPFDELPGFPHTNVSGHAGQLVLGRIGGIGVAVMEGRAHYYESGDAAAMKPALQTLAAIGCETVVLTNSAGSLKPEAGPGSLMMITDHIAFAGTNPLIGETGDGRFVDMTEPYDAELRSRLKQAAGALGITLHEGVYIWFSGPSFETPAEIRAARTLGADAIGMSTVPEVIIARWLNLRVAAVSVIANPASGMGAAKLTHEMSKKQSARGAADLVRLLRAFLGGLDDG